MGTPQREMGARSARTHTVRTRRPCYSHLWSSLGCRQLSGVSPQQSEPANSCEEAVGRLPPQRETTVSCRRGWSCLTSAATADRTIRPPPAEISSSAPCRRRNLELRALCRPRAHPGRWRITLSPSTSRTDRAISIIYIFIMRGWSHARAPSAPARLWPSFCLTQLAYK